MKRKKGRKKKEKLKLSIGVVGPMACGKGAVADYLMTRYGFVSFSLSFIVHQELEARGIKKFSRSTLQDIGDDLRQNFGGNILAKRAMKKLEKDGVPLVLIEGIRNPAEVIYLKSSNHFFLVSVDASRAIRFQRLTLRNKPWDPKTWEDFLKVDKRDLGQGQEDLGQRVKQCMDQADFEITNNKDLGFLYEEAEKIIGKILGKRPELKEILHKE